MKIKYTLWFFTGIVTGLLIISACCLIHFFHFGTLTYSVGDDNTPVVCWDNKYCSWSQILSWEDYAKYKDSRMISITIPYSGKVGFRHYIIKYLPCRNNYSPVISFLSNDKYLLFVVENGDYHMYLYDKDSGYIREELNSYSFIAISSISDNRIAYQDKPTIDGIKGLPLTAPTLKSTLNVYWKLIIKSLSY